jgi:hypothetical protein
VGPVLSRSNMSRVKPQGQSQTGRCSAQQAFALGVSEQVLGRKNLNGLPEHCRGHWSS